VPDRHDHWIARQARRSRRRELPADDRPRDIEALHDYALTKTISLSLD
jgi:hypothetical protein